MAKEIKTIGCIAGGILAVPALGVLAYVFGHKPDVVVNVCYRSCHRADGRPKVAFDKAYKANWRSLTQLVLHLEVCNSYQVGDKFYTGHSKNAKNINIMLHACKKATKYFLPA